MEPAKRERDESEAVQQKSVMLTAQVLWCCHVWNATPDDAAQQVVADLYAHLSRGGSVSVRVEELGGKVYTLEAAATGPLFIANGKQLPTFKANL